jgi:hypothetical protein
MRRRDMTRHDIHENLTRDEPAAAGSERSFGLVMSIVLGGLGLLNFLHGGIVWPWLWIAGALFGFAGLLWPKALAPLNRAWLRLGLAMHVIVEPLVLGLVFYGAVLPIGLLMRVKHRDPLNLRIERDRTSYWIKREPPGPQPHTMKNQF